MDNKNISLLAVLGYPFLLAYFMVVTCTSSTHTSLCTKTPYPELCNSMISTTSQTASNENLLGLLAISLGTTLTHAKNAHNLISEMDLTSFNEQAKLAWADCLYLYEDTIHQLNRSIDLEVDTIHAQTWLSASIANIQTCRNGYHDFNLSFHFETFSTVLSHFPKLLSNSLAINKAIALSSSLYNGYMKYQNRRLLAYDFPQWISASKSSLLLSSGGSTRVDMVVAQDGSGEYKTINEALDAVAKRRKGSTKRFVIYVKKGIYKENVKVKKSMKNLMFIGDGIDQTVVTADKNVDDGSTTFRSATFAVNGDGFIARGMTFENTAGPQKHQAVALRSSSDFSIFYDCSFKGYQDTLYVHSQRQFYRNCDIYGTVDFIFGDAAAVVQNCNIYIRKPLIGQKNTVTAQGRTDPNENTGIIIHNSRITGAGSSKLGASESYLGRPWRKYSRTVFVKCRIDELINPAGWLPWSEDFGLSTLYYGEYMNTGSGANTRGRVKWPGFHVIESEMEAENFSVRKFLGGELWIPASGLPFTSGL